MKLPFNPWVLFAGLAGCASVALGAYASHGVSDLLASAALERASLYGLIHAVLLAVIAVWPGRVALLARLIFIVGIVLFSGTIAAKYLLGFSVALAPLGGTLLMLGWLLTAVAKPRA